MNLTLDVKNKSLVMPTHDLLTFRVMPQAKSSAEIRQEFGRYMQTERESKGVSQKYLAGKMKITVTQLSRIENGKSGTERDTVIIWARELGIDENEALRRFKPENELTNESHEILDGVQIIFQNGKNLTKKQQREILEAARIVARGVMAGGGAEDENAEK